MIPVFIAPVINRFDLLERLLASIDHPVERGIVVDNARSGYSLPPSVRRFTVFEPPFTSMGYTGSINYIIGQTPEAPWWLWCSNDEAFGPGDLANIAALMDEAGDRPRIVTDNYAWGALNRACVDAVGLFDEWSFWPIYFDDNDYALRCKFGGVEWVRYTGDVIHGADGHEAMLTVKSDPVLSQRNNVSWQLNEAAFRAKWGGLPTEPIQYTTPWGQSLPLWATKPDIAGRIARKW